MATRSIRVPDASARVRIDRALADLLPDQTRSAVARWIEQGLVRVEGRAVTRASFAVEGGTTIEVEVPEPMPPSAPAQELPLRLLYQDSDIAVIDKPAGLVVHPAAGHADGTLVNALLFHIEGLSGIGGELRPGIVHRLDKDTSGLMVIAKNDAAHRQLTAAWGTESVLKEYVAVVYGTPRAEQGTIDAPIGRDPRDRKRMAVVAGGRRAVTDYRLERRLRHTAVVRCVLRTGRTHQIRVHLRKLGHPIVGDPVYSGPQWKGVPDKRLQKTLSRFPRQALHAARLVIPHPSTGQPLTFEAELPADMTGLIAALE